MKLNAKLESGLFDYIFFVNIHMSKYMYIGKVYIEQLILKIITTVSSNFTYQMHSKENELKFVKKMGKYLKTFMNKNIPNFPGKM